MELWFPRTRPVRIPPGGVRGMPKSSSIQPHAFEPVGTAGNDLEIVHVIPPRENVRRVVERYEWRIRGDHRLQRAKIRSEEHTSELQSRQYLVCRLLLEKKKKKKNKK